MTEEFRCIACDELTPKDAKFCPICGTAQIENRMNGIHKLADENVNRSLRNNSRSTAQALMAIGAIAFAFGLALTIGSASQASNQGFFVFPWGVLLAGAALFFWGLFKFDS